MSSLVWGAVLVCGGTGAVLRFLLDGAVGGRVDGSFPVGTLVVNLSGSLALGILSGVALPAQAPLLVGSSLIGAYTTFSTWVFETHRLAEERDLATAWANVVLSVVAGLAAAAVGLWIGGGW
ncbi:MAG: fluoride efflux transporter CrcB [Actinomycetota bacterium]|nr:fluoride efflux transporter CrcB [Actinomycetota bacterium]